MIYGILNKIVERRISKLRPVAKNFLSTDRGGSNEVVSVQRLEADKKYLLLIEYFKKDGKRRYMINRNYIKYLKAIIYLYSTSSNSVRMGVITAPQEIYRIINSVQKSFEDLINRLKLGS